MILFFITQKTLMNLCSTRFFQPHKPEYIKRFNKIDEKGRRYRDDRPTKRKQYLDETNGVALTDVWSDIMSFQQNLRIKRTSWLPYPKTTRTLRTHHQSVL